MQIHALEATGGFAVLADGHRELAKPGRQVAARCRAAAPSHGGRQLDPTTKQPVSNGARDVWVTETALYDRAQHDLHGEPARAVRHRRRRRAAASGFGFAILAIGGALRNPENTLNSIFGRRAPKTVGSTPLPTA